MCSSNAFKFRCQWSGNRSLRRCYPHGSRYHDVATFGPTATTGWKEYPSESLRSAPLFTDRSATLDRRLSLRSRPDSGVEHGLLALERMSATHSTASIALGLSTRTSSGAAVTLCRNPQPVLFALARDISEHLDAPAHEAGKSSATKKINVLLVLLICCCYYYHYYHHYH